jgi:MFS family permease
MLILIFFFDQITLVYLILTPNFKIPGGWLSLKFGPKIVLGLSTLLASTLTFLLPFTARLSPYALIVCRFLIGALNVCF